MDKNLEEKFNVLKQLLEKAYEIYSHFPVSSIIETVDKKIYYGVNVENASYPNGICAERNAIGSAITDQGKNMKIAKIFLLSKSSDNILPCGMCLQVISEFVSFDTKLFSFNLKQDLKEYKFTDLFPQYFNKESLGEINEK